jgi:hypothetical protein
LADGILDRLVNNAQGIEMRGDSMRKNGGKLKKGCCARWRWNEQIYNGASGSVSVFV